MKNVKNSINNFQVLGDIFICLCLLIPLLTTAQDSSKQSVSKRFEIKGFVKNMQTASFTNQANSLITGNLIHQRINLKWIINNTMFARIESRNRFFYGEQIKISPGFSKIIEADNGYFDLTSNILSETNLVLNTTLDRALINWSNKKWEITVGRQRINWGINTVWNPNDIFNTFNYFDFDYEERPGSDAIRLQYTSGVFSSFQFAYKFDKNKNKQVGALIYKTNMAKFDWQNFVGIYNEDIVAGTGWAGNLKQTGFKGEASYFHSYKNTDSIGTLSTSVSFVRTFKGNYFTVFSYLYNSCGKDVIYNMADASALYLSAKNLLPFKHTFFAQISKSINPLITVNFSTMFSPTKKSLILFPTLTISLNDNWDLSFIAQSFFADSNNSYHSIANSIFMRLRWSY